MYLRETRRTNKDGSVVRYLQLAHNERHPVSGVPAAKVIYNFGRAENVDRAALARLVASISCLTRRCSSTSLWKPTPAPDTHRAATSRPGL